MSTAPLSKSTTQTSVVAVCFCTVIFYHILPFNMVEEFLKRDYTKSSVCAIHIYRKHHTLLHYCRSIVKLLYSKLV